MARFSVKNELSPAGTVLGVGTSFSNSVRVESIRDLRIFLFISALAGGGLLDAVVQMSPDNSVWTDGQSIPQISTVDNFVKTLEEHEISTFARLKYVVTVAAVTLEAITEGKQGV